MGEMYVGQSANNVLCFIVPFKIFGDAVVFIVSRERGGCFGSFYQGGSSCTLVR